MVNGQGFHGWFHAWFGGTESRKGEQKVNLKPQDSFSLIKMKSAKKETGFLGLESRNPVGLGRKQSFMRNNSCINSE